MEIIVETGTQQQKEEIREELSCIEQIAGVVSPPPPIKQLIVPADFDGKVNELQGTNDYKSRRGQVAVAKNIEIEDGISLVFSPYLYTKEYDYHIRLFIYIHELIHAFNRERFPKHKTESKSAMQNIINIYILFDEYDADRKTLKIIDENIPSKSILYKRSMYKDLKSHIRSLVDSPVYYQKIRRDIFNFRSHGNVTLFLENVHPYYDEVSKAIVHIYPFIDHLPKLKNLQSLLSKSQFINNTTLKLIDFFRAKHESTDPDLLDGLDLMDSFMANFGMKFEDRPEGLYCHVLDI